MGGFAPSSVGLLEPLDPWLQDTKVSEILLNKPGEVYVEKEGKLKRFEVPSLNERAVKMLFQLIANENAQELSSKKPLGVLARQRRKQGIRRYDSNHPAYIQA